MRILLSSADLIDLVTKHAFSALVPDAKAADVEVGILNGQIVAAIAVGEDNFALKSIADLTGPLTSGSVALAEPVPAPVQVEEEDEGIDETSGETGDDGKPKRRKRRTKAEIEADKAAEEAAAQTEVEAEAEAQLETPEVDPFAEASVEETPNEADDAAPFDIDEGATVRAEADVIPETKAEEVDPFADAGVSTSEGDELFAQDDVPVTQVVETSEAGFAKPTETEDDPFANFD